MYRALAKTYAVVGMLLVLCFGILSTIPILPFAVLPRGRRERYAIRGAQWFAWMILRPLLMLRIERVGLEHLPPKGGYLVISNHRSWIDVPILMLYTRSEGISKKEVKYVPFFGMNGYLSGAIFFDRKKKLDRARVVSEALLLLRGGANLHVFPEGTRTRTGKLNTKVFLRLVETCWENGVDVVPACVWGTERTVPAGEVIAWPWQQVGIEVRPPLDRAAFTDREAYAKACWEQVVEIARRRGCDEPFTA